MISSKIEAMRPLLESTSGVHLTAYIANQGNLHSLKKDLSNALDQASEYLIPAMETRQIEQFLKPIQVLLSDSKKLGSFTGNLGVFRTQTSFRALSLPIDLENSCIVADTFHVKPLLKWIQSDRDFLLLGIDAKSATLFQGNLDSMKEIDTIVFSDFLGDSKSGETMPINAQIMEWLNALILNLTMNSSPRLFIVGSRELSESVQKRLHYDQWCMLSARSSYAPDKLGEICYEIRSVLQADIRKDFEKTIVEFHHASDVNLAKGNIFTIAKAAVQGRIRKLLVSEGIKIFGKLNRKSGALTIHEGDLDHEDDDLLDDLAQTVLAHGGKVMVAPLKVIPKKRPILAIIDELPNLEMTKPKTPTVEWRYFNEGRAL